MPQKILIVDDDKFLLDMYALKFSEHSFEVATAMSGPEVISKLEAAGDDAFSIVLLDIVMPGMDGFEVLAKIKEKSLAKNSVLIVLSNLGQKEDIEKGLSLGARGYIVKASATPSEVVTKVQEIIAKTNA